jgi:hypothetical protein
LIAKVVSLLGRLESSSAQVDSSKTVPNSTRWVFDVEHEPGSFAFDLVTRQGKVIRPLVLSFSIAPLDPDFYSAGVFFSKTNGTGLELTCTKTTRYRVTVDMISSLVH